MPRKEDARLLTGRGQYVDDVVLPGMLHVAFARSTIARGKILSIDTEAARAVSGVRAVYTMDDLTHFNIQMVSSHMILPPPGPKVYPLAKDRVAHVGDPIAMVVAETRYIAEDAAALVMADYEEEDPVVTMAQAKDGAPVHPDIPNNIAATMTIPHPELEQTLATAPHLVTGTVKHQRIAQSPMEGRGVVASKNGDELTVYMGCQGPHVTARMLALGFGIPHNNIRVIAKDVGGGFGLKTQPWREEVATIAASMLLGRPLKWIEDRLENLTTANLAREQECTLRMGFDADGKLLAAHLDYDLNNGAFPHMPDANSPIFMFMWPAYKMPRPGFSLKGWYTNTIGLGGYRGPWAMESLVRETVLDIAARQIGIDPIEIRRRNLKTAADQPFVLPPFGVTIDDLTPYECLENLLKTVDVLAFRAEQAAARKEGRYLGLGVATYVEPTAISYMHMSTDMAQIRIEPTGKVTAVLSTHSQGHGTQTTNAQVIAESLGVPFDDVSVFEGDTSRGNYGPGAAGSRQAIGGGGASIRASKILVDKIKRIAAHLLNASPEAVRIENGMVRVSGAEEMTRSLEEIALIAYHEPDRLPSGMEPGLEAQYRYRPPPMTFTSAAHACFVEVDAETGFVTIKRWVCSEDCGVVINPSVVEGQVAGGLAQAIGMVLLEEASFDERGNPTAVTFKDYLMPAIADVPDFEYTHITTPSKAEGGFRGIGEGGAIVGPPTLVNAIADALVPFGAVCLDLPLTPSKILKLMENRQA
jgi:carbon-monoxide dehydrogenase large subunit